MPSLAQVQHQVQVEAIPSQEPDGWLLYTDEASDFCKQDVVMILETPCRLLSEVRYSLKVTPLKPLDIPDEVVRAAQMPR